jgi:F0F1-type ATP synthase membrane subunit b/b'
MTEKTVDKRDKFLAQMLEGAEQGIKQMDNALSQIDAQRENIINRRNELVDTANELKVMLGLTDEIEPEGGFWKNDTTL